MLLSFVTSLEVVCYLSLSFSFSHSFRAVFLVMNCIPPLPVNIRIRIKYPPTLFLIYRTLDHTQKFNMIFPRSKPNHTLPTLLSKFKDLGLVCYWSGGADTNYSLWRITDCYQQYYDYKHYAKIQCVSHKHPDVQILAQRMEAKFLETLQSDKTY